MLLRAVILAATMACPAAVAAVKPADLVFLNGAVYTVDAARSWASAVAVSGGRIAYVGDDAGARAYVGGATRVVDLARRMLLPGFQDSHVHPGDAPNPATALDVHGLRTREQILDRIRDYAAAHPEKPWIVGDGWDEVAFLPSGQPSRQMLDSVVPDRPAFLTDNSGHEAWANSRALAAAGITAATPDPINGRIERDADGAPSGALQEDAAMDLVQAVIPPASAAEHLADLTAALQTMSRLGYTAVEDAMTSPEIARAYRELDRRGALPVRAQLCLPFRPLEADEGQIQAFVAARKALKGTRVSAGCVKLFLDGAYGSHTLVLLQPYSDEPKFGVGQLFIEQQRLNRLVVRLDALGFRIHVHAQGDGAVRAALDAFAEARRRNGPLDHRHTIAHLCLIDQADMPRFRSLGVIANMSPLWSVGDTWETVFAPRLFGPERSQRLLQSRTLLEAGAILVWGSDWPVTGVSALDGLESATTHRYPGGKDPDGREDQVWSPGERVSLEQAIVAYTSAGAYLQREDRMRGSIETGKAADLTVLHANLFDVAPFDLHTVAVDMTVMAGQVTFERAER